MTPARVAEETGIAWAQVQQLARDFAASPTAALYGRCGASLGLFSTLTKYLIDVINIVTGNLDRRGGMVYGQPMLDTEAFTRLFKVNGYDRWRTRVDGIPEVMGTSPLATLPREIRTPGQGQLRALLIASGNIATTSCASGDVGAALDELDLLISLDPYITETNQRAHYILPPTLWLGATACRSSARCTLACRMRNGRRRRSRRAAMPATASGFSTRSASASASCPRPRNSCGSSASSASA